jgi:hypothetical protein
MDTVEKIKIYYHYQGSNPGRLANIPSLYPPSSPVCLYFTEIDQIGYTWLSIVSVHIAIKSMEEQGKRYCIWGSNGSNGSISISDGGVSRCVKAKY